MLLELPVPDTLSEPVAEGLPDPVLETDRLGVGDGDAVELVVVVTVGDTVTEGVALGVGVLLRLAGAFT